MSTKETIREFSGRIIGEIETKPNGDKIVRDFYGRILGQYRAQLNITTDFYGKTIATGDASAMLLKQ